MRVFRTKDYITEEERLEVLQWFENSSKDGTMVPGLNREVWGYKDRVTTRQQSSFTYPTVIDKIYDRILSSFTFPKGFHKETLPCGKGFIAVTTFPVGDTYLHQDPANCKNNMSVIRFNILIQKADEGGELELFDTDDTKSVLSIEEKELYVCNLSDYKHSVSIVRGNKPRHILLFSICCPAEDWESGNVKYIGE